MKNDVNGTPYGSTIYLSNEREKAEFSTLFEVYKELIRSFSSMENFLRAQDLAKQITKWALYKNTKIVLGTEVDVETENRFQINIKSRLIRELLNDPIVRDVVVSREKSLETSEECLNGVIHTAVFLSILSISNHFLKFGFADYFPEHASFPRPTIQLSQSDMGVLFDLELIPILTKFGNVSPYSKCIIKAALNSKKAQSYFRPKKYRKYDYSPISFNILRVKNDTLLTAFENKRMSGLSIYNYMQHRSFIVY